MVVPQNKYYGIKIYKGEEVDIKCVSAQKHELEQQIIIGDNTNDTVDGQNLTRSIISDTIIKCSAKNPAGSSCLRVNVTVKGKLCFLHL